MESMLGTLLASLQDLCQGGTAPAGIAPPRQLAEQEPACPAGLCRRGGTLHGRKKNPLSGAILAGNTAVWHTLPTLLRGAAPTGMAVSWGWTVPPAAREEQTTGDGQPPAGGRKATGREVAWERWPRAETWGGRSGSGQWGAPAAAAHAWRHEAEQEGLVMRSEPGDNLLCYLGQAAVPGELVQRQTRGKGPEVREASDAYSCALVCVRLRRGVGEVSERRHCPPCCGSRVCPGPVGKGTVCPSCPSLACSGSCGSLGGGKELNPAFFTSLSPSMKKQHPSPLATFFEGKRTSARAFCRLLVLAGMEAVLRLKQPRREQMCKLRLG